MATIIKLPPRDGPPEGAERPASPAGGQGLGSVQVTPPIIAVAILTVVLILGGLFFFARPGALGGGAAAQMMDTGTETMAPGQAEKHANGMDSSTDSPGPPAGNNGMDSSTGQ
jgi:hypothetical protein